MSSFTSFQEQTLCFYSQMRNKHSAGQADIQMPRLRITVCPQNSYGENGSCECGLQPNLWSQSCCGGKLIKVCCPGWPSVTNETSLWHVLLLTAADSSLESHLSLRTFSFFASFYFGSDSPHKHGYACAFCCFGSSPAKFVVSVCRDLYPHTALQAPGWTRAGFTQEWLGWTPRALWTHLFLSHFHHGTWCGWL